MQNELIDLIFDEFKQNFRHFFDPCDRGFINEVIINMLSRRYHRPKTDSKKQIVHPGHKLEQLYFTIEGAFGLFHPTLKIKGQIYIN